MFHPAVLLNSFSSSTSFCVVLVLEKEMATHSSVLAWRIPGMGEPDGLPSMGSHRVRHDWSDLAAAAAVIFVGFAVLNDHRRTHWESEISVNIRRKWGSKPFRYLGGRIFLIEEITTKKSTEEAAYFKNS